MNYSQIRKYIANYDDKSWTSGTYAISNEYGLLAIVYADHESDALDAAVDNDMMNGELMDPETQAEYEAEDWGVCYAGNAGEAIHTDNLGITLIKSR